MGRAVRTKMAIWTVPLGSWSKSQILVRILESHEKQDVYEMCRVKEYIVWRTEENQAEWFVLRNERYQKIGTVDGVITSETFAGLALNVAALLEGNSCEVIETLRNAINER